MDKQFEEMVKIAEDALASPKFEIDCPDSPCPYLNNKSVYCDTCIVLNALYDKGYRKQSEGEWIGKGMAHCSECGNVVNFRNVSRWLYNFCPNCGAKMKGGES